MAAPTGRHGVASAEAGRSAEPSPPRPLVCRAHEGVLRLGAGAAYRLYGMGRTLREMDRVAGLSGAEVEAESMARLRELLEHAFARVPKYRDLARREGLTPGAFRCYGDLRRLPIITRRDLQGDLEPLRAEVSPYGPGKPGSTSGSTGEPVRFYHDKHYHRVNWAVKSWQYELCGHRIGEPIALLVPTPFDTPMRLRPVSRAVDRLSRNAIRVDLYNTTDEGRYLAHERIVGHDPTLIGGYARGVAAYCQFLRATGLRRPRPRGVQVTGEPLLPEQRESIEDTLGCPVLDRYGSHEAGLIAHDCRRRSGLHIAAPANLVEVVDAGGDPCPPGQTGRVLVTNLTNLAMPLMRYEVGDVASWADGPCACGCGGPRLAAVSGRTCEVIRCPNGKLLYGTFFSGVMRSAGGVQEFQVVQESVEDLTIRFVALPGADVESTQRRARELVAQRADPGFRVRFEVHHQELPTSPSGKHQFVISRLEEPAPWTPDPQRAHS